MLAQGIRHQQPASGHQLAARPPIPREEHRAQDLAEVKARRESPLIPGDLLARSQNIQPSRGAWSGAFVAWFKAPKSAELVITSQPQPPPQVLRQRQPDQLLTALRHAAEAADARQFAEICDATNWKNRSSSELARAIGLALKAGALMTARRLAGEGVSYHPEAEDLRKYARLLAPPELLRTGLPADPGLQADLAWFKQHRAMHRGRWVALRHGTLLAEGPTLQEVLAKIGDAKAVKGLLLTRVR